MREYVLDASALLALLNAEQGSEIVQGLLPRAIISTVNLSEVVSRLSLASIPEGQIREILAYLGLEIVDFDEVQALHAGLLSVFTRPLGLSLGDRACLALAKTNSAIAVSADRAWKDLEIGINIQMIR
jgi:PIN domain nuclease of toxin-antitoxin system